MFKTSTETKKIMAALFEAKKKFQTVKKGATNPFYKSKYADLNSVIDATDEELTSVGIMVLQPPTSENGNNFVTTRLQHVESGEWLEAEMKLELVKPGMQELGSAVTYSRRYSLQSLLGLQAEDDDGNAASKPVPKHAAKLAQTGTAGNSEIKANDTVTTEETKPTNGTGKKSTFKRPDPEKTEDWN